jgi:hypothetical protein
MALKIDVGGTPWTKLGTKSRQLNLSREFFGNSSKRNETMPKAYEVGARLSVTVHPRPAILSFSESIARHQKSDATSYESFIRTAGSTVAKMRWLYAAKP